MELSYLPTPAAEAIGEHLIADKAFAQLAALVRTSRSFYTACQGLLTEAEEKRGVSENVGKKGERVVWYGGRGLINRGNDKPAVIRANGTQERKRAKPW